MYIYTYLDSTKQPLLMVAQVIINSVGTDCIIISLNNGVESNEGEREG